MPEMEERLFDLSSSWQQQCAFRECLLMGLENQGCYWRLKDWGLIPLEQGLQTEGRLFLLACHGLCDDSKDAERSPQQSSAKLNHTITKFRIREKPPLRFAE